MVLPQLLSLLQLLFSHAEGKEVDCLEATFENNDARNHKKMSLNMPSVYPDSAVPSAINNFVRRLVFETPL